MAIIYTPNRNLAKPGLSTPGADWYGAINLNFDKIDDILKPLTPGSVVFADADGNLGQDNDGLFWDDTNKRLGIGLNAPLAGLHILGGDGAALETRSNTPDIGSQLDLRRASASLGLVSNNDVLGRVIFAGHDGTAFRQAAMIRGEVAGTPGPGDVPGRLMFLTTPAGTTTPVERMRIDGSGAIDFWATLHAQADADVITNMVEAQVAGDGLAAPFLKFTRSRGSLASPASMNNLDSMGGLVWNGRGSVAFKDVASMKSIAWGTPTHPNFRSALMWHIRSGDWTDAAMDDLDSMMLIAGASWGDPPALVIGYPSSPGTFSSTKGILDLNGDTIRLRTARTPASSAAPGYDGEVSADDNYVYRYCTSAWKRIAWNAF